MKTNTKITALPPICRKCGRELTAPSAINKELVARRSTMDAIANILTARGHNNVVITGGAGTGKTAIVQAVSSGIAAGAYPGLNGRRIVEVSLDHLLKECYTPQDRGVRLGNLFEEAKREDIVLFIDEGHRICGSGGSDNLANAAKPYLTSEELQVILATTTDEFKKYIEQDSAIRRRFEKVCLEEPDAAETEKILNNILLERYPDVKAEPCVLHRLIEIGNRYCRDRNNPDKSISLLDHTISWMKNNEAGTVITRDCMAQALSLRLNISEGALEMDMRTALKKLTARLSEKFAGWDSQMDKLAEPLGDALIKSGRPGPLCAVMLTGADTELLKEVAKEAAVSLGFVGRDEIAAVSIADYAASAVDADIFDDPLVAPLLNNPHTAMIIEDLDKVGADMVFTNRLTEVMRKGLLKDQKGRVADYSMAPVFFICPGELHQENSIGFAEGSDIAMQASQHAKQLAKKLSGCQRDGLKLVCFGAPSKDKAVLMKDRLFPAILGEAARRTGLNGRLTLDATADAEVQRLAAGPTAWSDLRYAAERIVRSALLSEDSRACSIHCDNGAFGTVPVADKNNGAQYLEMEAR